MIKARTVFLFVMHVLFSASLFAQQNNYPVIKPAADSVADAVLPGWHIAGKATYGDLDNDKLEDVAFVMESDDTLTEYLYNNETKKYDDEQHTASRILVVLLKNKDGKYRLGLQNNDFILRQFEGGICCDPFLGLYIKNGTLIIPFYGGLSHDKWENTYVFRYQKSNWCLIGASVMYTHMEDSGENTTSSGTENSYNFLTNKMSVTDYEDLENAAAKPKVKWKTISKMPLKTFQTFIRPFTWEIEKGVYL